MAKTDPRVDAYVENAAEFARPILERLRKMVHETCPDVTETIKWGAPFFEWRGTLCMMVAFKSHCGFGFWNAELKARIVKAEGTAEEGMGCFGRIESPKDLPAAGKLKAYIREAMVLNENGKAPRPKAATARAELTMPDELAKALKKDRAAAKTWEAFPPSCRREYIEWITEAKRGETRAKRLATTVEWLREGKRRNWKYEGC